MSNYSIPGYSLYHTDSLHGCAIYTNKIVLDYKTLNTVIEAVILKTEDFVITHIYIPPVTTMNVITKHVSELLHICLCLQNLGQSRIIMSGDFNKDLILDSNKKLLDVMHNNFLLNFVDSPSHIAGGILDLLFSNHPC